MEQLSYEILSSSNLKTLDDLKAKFENLRSIIQVIIDAVPERLKIPTVDSISLNHKEQILTTSIKNIELCRQSLGAWLEEAKKISRENIKKSDSLEKLSGEMQVFNGKCQECLAFLTTKLPPGHVAAIIDSIPAPSIHIEKKDAKQTPQPSSFPTLVHGLDPKEEKIKNEPKKTKNDFDVLQENYSKSFEAFKQALIKCSNKLDNLSSESEFVNLEKCEEKLNESTQELSNAGESVDNAEISDLSTEFGKKLENTLNTIHKEAIAATKRIKLPQPLAPAASDLEAYERAEEQLKLLLIGVYKMFPESCASDEGFQALIKNLRSLIESCQTNIRSIKDDFPLMETAKKGLLSTDKKEKPASSEDAKQTPQPDPTLVTRVVPKDRKINIDQNEIGNDFKTLHKNYSESLKAYRKVLIRCSDKLDNLSSKPEPEFENLDKLEEEFKKSKRKLSEFGVEVDEETADLLREFITKLVKTYYTVNAKSDAAAFKWIPGPGSTRPSISDSKVFESAEQELKILFQAIYKMFPKTYSFTSQIKTLTEKIPLSIGSCERNINTLNRNLSLLDIDREEKPPPNKDSNEDNDEDFKQAIARSLQLEVPSTDKEEKPPSNEDDNDDDDDENLKQAMAMSVLPSTPRFRSKSALSFLDKQPEVSVTTNSLGFLDRKLTRRQSESDLSNFSSEEEEILSSRSKGPHG